MRELQYEMRGYPADADNAFLTDNPNVEVALCRNESAARAKAGRFAKRINGPVDLAFAGDEPWEDRYITTVSPSRYHSSGYRCERLDS